MRLIDNFGVEKASTSGEYRSVRGPGRYFGGIEPPLCTVFSRDRWGHHGVQAVLRKYKYFQNPKTGPAEPWGHIPVTPRFSGVGRIVLSVDQRDARTTRYDSIAKTLATVNDRELMDLVAAVPPMGSGIGRALAALEIDGTKVIVKRIPLTDRENQPRNRRSTANIFTLPLYFQYGVSSVGFGAWRELASQIETTNWVLAGDSENFPLMYHWRVLPRPRPPSLTLDEAQQIDHQVTYWGGSPAIRARLSEIRSASADVLLFLEYIPQNLRVWLGEQVRKGQETALAALTMVEHDLREVTSFMGSRGMLHFDAHFDNLLTDGHRLYFADLGLALSKSFDLSAEEAAFLERHADFDRAYVMTRLVNHLVDASSGFESRNAVVREHVHGTKDSRLPQSQASLVKRYASTAMLMNDFYARLRTESKTTVYPAEQIGKACRAAGLLP
jgi:hypothetical protein